MFHIVRSMRRLNQFQLEHKRRLGANSLSTRDFFNDLHTDYCAYVFDVGVSLQSLDRTQGELKLRGWLITLVYHEWRLNVVNVGEHSDLVWWDLLQSGEFASELKTTPEVLHQLDLLDQAFAAPNATATQQLLVLFKLGMP